MRWWCTLLALVLVAAPRQTKTRYGDPHVRATVDLASLAECSGLWASHQRSGLLWAINDSNSPAELIGVTLDGRQAQRVRVQNARNEDWEDISGGPCPAGKGTCLYIADIGDNDRRRSTIDIYIVNEPTPSATSVTAQRWRLRYPDRPHDAEALLVHPKTGSVYLITKARGKDTQTAVYQVPAQLALGATGTLRHVADLHFPDESPVTLAIGRVTGAAISPDGQRVALCDYLKAYESVLPSGESFDQMWAGPWQPFALGGRRQGEAITYRSDGRAILAGSEGRPFPLNEVTLER